MTTGQSPAASVPDYAIRMQELAEAERWAEPLDGTTECSDGGCGSTQGGLCGCHSREVNGV